MRKLVNPLFYLLLISLQGCYTTLPSESTAETNSEAVVVTPHARPSQSFPPPGSFSMAPEQAGVYHLFLRSMQYQGLEKSQQKIACKQLKQDYDSLANWQTAWLLVYAINADFSCIPLKRSLELLQTIQAAPDSSAQLQWLHSNQINLLNQLEKMQKEKINLNRQLQKVQAELEAENSKIEALKAIETDINKKLDNAEMQLEEENSKIEALKAIETDLNKKLDE
jgi:flagellar motor switch/type III secretory pathway protein FliN